MISVSDEVKQDVQVQEEHTQSPQSEHSPCFHIVPTRAEKQALCDSSNPDYMTHDPKWLDQLDRPRENGSCLLAMTYDADVYAGPNDTRCHEDYVNTPEFAHDARRAMYMILRGEGPMSDAATIVFCKPRVAVNRVIESPVNNKKKVMHGIIGKVFDLQERYGEVPWCASKADAIAWGCPVPAEMKVLFATFDRVCARVLVNALDIVKFDASAQIIDYDDEENVEPEPLDLERMRWMYRREDGVYAELTDETLNTLINGMMHRLPDNMYTRAKRLVRASARQIEVVDEMRYLAVDNGRKLYDMTKEPGTEGSIIPCPDGLIALNPIPLDYVPDAYDERADRFLDAIAGHDAANRRLTCQVLGTAFTRSENPIAVCQGNTIDNRRDDNQNGKTTMFDVAKRMLGRRNYSCLELGRLDSRFGSVELMNKIANFDGDASADIVSKNLASAMKKMSADGDEMVGEKKGVQKLEYFRPTATLFIATNTGLKLSMVDSNGAFDRRVVNVFFPNHFTKDSPDYDPELVRYVKRSRRAHEYLFKCFVEGLADLKRTGEFAKTEFSRRLDLKRLVDNNLVAQWLLNSDTLLSRNMILGIDPCPDLACALTKDFSLKGRDAYLRGHEGKFDPANMRCDVVNAWWLVFCAWCDEQGNVQKIRKETFTKAMNELLGLKQMSTSWPGEKGRRKTGRVFVSDSDYKSYATGLGLPVLDAMGEEERAAIDHEEKVESAMAHQAQYGEYKLDVRLEAEQIRPKVSVRRPYDFTKGETDVVKAFEKVLAPPSAVLTHTPVVMGRDMAMWCVCTNRGSDEAKRETVAKCKGRLDVLRKAYKVYLDYRRASDRLMVYELCPSYVRGLAEAAASMAIETAPKPEGVFAVMATPESEATRLAGLADAARSCVTSMAERIRSCHTEDEVEAYQALIVSVLEYEIAALDDILSSDCDFAAKLTHAVEYGNASHGEGDEVYVEQHRLCWLARTTAGAGKDVLTIDEVLGLDPESYVVDEE